MTIATLIYIRDLLEKDITDKEAAAEETRQALNQAEYDENINMETLKTLKGARQLALRKVGEARAALEDFNAAEWHC